MSSARLWTLAIVGSVASLLAVAGCAVGTGLHAACAPDVDRYDQTQVVLPGAGDGQPQQTLMAGSAPADAMVARVRVDAARTKPSISRCKAVRRSRPRNATSRPRTRRSRRCAASCFRRWTSLASASRGNSSGVTARGRRLRPEPLRRRRRARLRGRPVRRHTPAHRTTGRARRLPARPRRRGVSGADRRRRDRRDRCGERDWKNSPRRRTSSPSTNTTCSSCRSPKRRASPPAPTCSPPKVNSPATARCCRRCASSSTLRATQLAVLVGRYPGASGRRRSSRFASMTLPTDLPLTLPSELVRARPDILAAEAQLHAASAAVGVATAQLYPSLTLSGSWTTTAGRPAAICSARTATSGRLRPDSRRRSFTAAHCVREQRAAVDTFAAQLALYRQTVLQAFGQVADALNALAARCGSGRSAAGRARSVARVARTDAAELRSGSGELPADPRDAADLSAGAPRHRARREPALSRHGAAVISCSAATWSARRKRAEHRATSQRRCKEPASTIAAISDGRCLAPAITYKSTPGARHSALTCSARPRLIRRQSQM